MFTGDVNACVRGLVAGGATDVLVNEAHDSQRNLLLEELDERARMLTGRHKPLSMMQGIDSGVDGVVFLGYHAGAGAEGVLAHTYLANSITGVWLDGVARQRGPAQRRARRRVRRAGAGGHRRRPDLRGRRGLRTGRATRRGEGVREPVRGDLRYRRSAPPNWIESAAKAAMSAAGRRDAVGPPTTSRSSSTPPIWPPPPPSSPPWTRPTCGGSVSTRRP